MSGKRFKVLITGSNGQLAKKIRYFSELYDYHFVFKSKSELDITDYSLLSNFVKKNKPKYIINCAAYTNVNTAEKNKDKCNMVNNIAVGYLSKLCKENNIQLIHISTDYVFDGSKHDLYIEEDFTNPLNYYGSTKLEGEKKILDENLSESIILRTSWLYSDEDNNFVKKILEKIYKSEDILLFGKQIGSPTNAMDLAKTILDILPKIKNKKTEIYHYSNLGFCSRLELTKKIIELSKSQLKIHQLEDNNDNSMRPMFTPLNSNKISKSFGIDLIDWTESLSLFLKQNYSV